MSVFADLAAGKGRSDLGTDLQQRLAQLQAESSTLRANSAQLQSQIDHLCQSRDTYLRDLQRAEKHLDKQKMEFDKERAEWRTQREASGATNKPVANGSGHSTPNARTSEPEPSPATPAAASNATNAPPSAETTERIAVLEQLAGSRLQELETLREQHVAANKELDRLKLQAHHPPESQLRESPFFQVYLTQLSAQAARADTLQARFESAEQKLDQLRDANLEFRDAVVAEARTEVETLRQQLGKKDTDLARLRGQRDEMNAELLERRTRESEKSRFAEEVEALCTARQERISFLTSEVRRLKGKLASHDGAEGFLAFLKGDGGIDGDYVKSLEEQLVAAKDKTGALTAQIESLASGDAAAAEMAVRTELAEAKRSLSKYQRVLGSADVADDVKQLAERLQEAITSKSQLELKLSESEASTDALYAEVEGLSKQWETLEQTLRTKVFELKDGELRMARLSTEKAKADNKFFQAMRAKEAIEAECKTAQRSVDKQLKLLERARDVERALTAQIVSVDLLLFSMRGGRAFGLTESQGATGKGHDVTQERGARIADAARHCHLGEAPARAPPAAKPGCACRSSAACEHARARSCCRQGGTHQVARRGRCHQALARQAAPEARIAHVGERGGQCVGTGIADPRGARKAAGECEWEMEDRPIRRGIQGHAKTDEMVLATCCHLVHPRVCGRSLRPDRVYRVVGI